MHRHNTLAILAAAAFIAMLHATPAKAASCDGEWSITLERTVRGGKAENYEGRLSISNGTYTLKAMADIYVMVSEGPIADCKLSGAKLSFTNRSSNYAFDIALDGNAGIGEWYDTTFRKKVIARR